MGVFNLVNKKQIFSDYPVCNLSLLHSKRRGGRDLVFLINPTNCLILISRLTVLEGTVFFFNGHRPAEQASYDSINSIGLPSRVVAFHPVKVPWERKGNPTNCFCWLNNATFRGFRRSRIQEQSRAYYTVSYRNFSFRKLSSWGSEFLNIADISFSIYMYPNSIRQINKKV